MSLTSWVLKIVGIISLTVITEIIIPNSKTTKIIKGVMAFVTVFVIATPIVDLFESKIELNVLNSTEELSISTELSNTIYDIRYNNALNDIDLILKDNNVINAKVHLNAKNNDTFLEIENIQINLDNAVILDKEQNTIDLGKINQLIANKFDLSLDKVIFV